MPAELCVPSIIAHRGACSSAPENTLAAMRRARDLGATWVEFDVHLTKDLVPVVIHGDGVASTTNGVGRISEMLSSDLHRLDAGFWFSSMFKGEKVPTLKAMLDCLIECGLGANIEMKPEPGREGQMVEMVLGIVEEKWPAAMPRLLFSSFSRKEMCELRSRSEDVLIGFLMHVWDEEWRSIVTELSCVSVHANFRLLTEARVAAIKASGRKVLAYTVNSVRQADKLFAWGVDAIITDFPGRMISREASVQDR